MIWATRQFEADNGGGTVPCATSIYLSVRKETTACGFSRQPVDDPIDEVGHARQRGKPCENNAAQHFRR